MKVKVIGTWNGGTRHSQTLEWNDRYGRGFRDSVSFEDWGRKAASASLDLLESVYGFNRSSVRFEVR